jgi:DNA-binding NarL/FixJ family response regulator
MACERCPCRVCRYERRLRLQAEMDSYPEHPFTLTRKQRRVLYAMLRGLSLRETARRLGAQEGAIKEHRDALRRKFKVDSMEEIAALMVLPLDSPLLHGRRMN